MNADIEQILALAIQAYEAGKLEEAEKLFQYLTTKSPSDPTLYSFLGLIAIKANKKDDAIYNFLEASRREPNNPLHHANLAGAFLLNKQLEEAITASNDALAIDVNHRAALLSSGTALLELGKIPESMERLHRFAALSPNSIEDLLKLAKRMTFLKQANAVFELILEANPRLIPVRFSKCFSNLLLFYQDEEQMTASRAKYEQELIELRNLCRQATPDELSKAASEVGAIQPFHLPYQEQNDRELQTIYGDVVAMLMKARYPEFEKTLTPSQRSVKDKRIRVGIVSGHFYSHSVWKTHIRGWIKQINRKDFSVFGYYTGNQNSQIITEAETYLEQFTWGNKTLEKWIAAIKNDHLDVIIYPEIGMDAMSMRLASLRLAPIQCTSSGHPETSGLQTIDYFLSSALMEPPDGDRHYTEKLIRLPNLSIYYESYPVPRLLSTRSDFGLKEDAILYWCCQVPIKYLPQYDDVLVKIVREVPNAQLVFVESVEKLEKPFRLRIKHAFARFGLDASKYCAFLPKLNSREFVTAIHLMDVFLDSLGWSGWNTTMESLPYNLPIVTFPGPFMRSRHTAAILTMMGMEDWIATSLDNYIERAVSLGINPEKRTLMRECIALHKDKVYRDESTIIALENFLKSLFL